MRHVSTCLDHLQGVTEYQYNIYKNIDWLLNALKYVHKVPEDVAIFVCSRVELVHKTYRLQLRRFTGRFISGGMTSICV